MVSFWVNPLGYVAEGRYTAKMTPTTAVTKPAPAVIVARKLRGLVRG